MKKIISIVCCAVFLFPQNITTAHAEDLPPLCNIGRECLEEMVERYAEQYSVSIDLAKYIAFNESGYNSNAKGDMYIICPSGGWKGTPVYARGVYQITRCYHPNVSDEQAFDAEYNIEYAMKLLAQGREMCEMQFTTCREYYAQ
jgi:soluble lytic murein transglycosylase-like protein